VGLYVNFDKPLSDAELSGFRGMVARRAKREPLQYILGSQEFCGLQFVVTPAVLIPRHDTAVLVEQALEKAAAAKSVLDIGTGSGCIAVALAKNLPAASVTAVDISVEALAVAGLNAENNGVSIEFAEGSIFEPVADRQFDLIVSNPPYIPTLDLAALQPEVGAFEPILALDGGADGLDFYRLISLNAANHLNPGGWLILEVGINQSEPVRELLASTGFLSLFTSKDSGGIDRVVGGRFNEGA
jgi:release factor glutamine methyltransferase